MTDSRPKVLLIATHPIQYHVPWFRELAGAPDIDFSVLFVDLPDAQQQGKGFGVAFKWDIPMLEGYRWQQVPERTGRGGLDGFFATRVVQPVALLKSLAPDVLILTGWQAYPLLQFLAAGRWLKIPVIMRGESNALRQRSYKVRFLHRQLLRQCAAFLTIGQANRAFYLGYGTTPEQLFDTSYFVENQRFVDATQRFLPERSALRSRWNIPDTATCFCYAGKLEPKKRVLDLLRALQLASARGSALLHLLVVGTGELMSEAQAMVKAQGLPVTFAGFLNQTEIAAAYVATDCLVLPSDFGETWGLVVNEAMACGRPAIVSDRVGCGADLIQPGVTGEMFPFGDTAALAEHMLGMAAKPDRVREMGRAAQALVLAKYTVERAAEGTLAAIRHVLRGR